MEKLAHDATSSTKGTVYHFHQVVKWCFELTAGQTLYIEKFGDIAVSDNVNIEVKAYSGNLTDSHENIWKTLSNWLDDAFDDTRYVQLILITTQETSSRSQFVGWNEKAPEEKLSILQQIQKEAIDRHKKSKKSEPSKALNLINKVLEKEKGELRSVLSKFFIFDSAPLSNALYEEVTQKYLKHILGRKAHQFLNSLVGFILSPTVIDGEGWAISFEDFTQEVQALTPQYAAGTRIFPSRPAINQNDSLIKRYDEFLFVEKILAIGYSEVIDVAKSDYFYAATTIVDEFKEGALAKYCKDFRSEVESDFQTRYRRACRSVSSDVNASSKNFYDDCLLAVAPAFSGYETTPKGFRNGVLHMEMDDDKKSLLWRLQKEGSDS